MQNTLWAIWLLVPDPIFNASVNPTDSNAAMPDMHTHQVQLKRSPGSVAVGSRIVTTDGTAHADDARELTTSVTTAAPSSQSALRPKSVSVASVIVNPVDRPVTPLSRSTAVPVLSNATHEVVTAAEIGLGGVDQEEINRLQQLLADAAEAVQELQTQHRQSLSEMQEVAVELATAAASWLVGCAIDRDMFAVDDLILKALEHLELNQSVRVRLHPADHSLLQTLLSDPVSRQQLDLVSCMKDETIPRGSVRIESGRRILLTDMHTRLEEIRRTWMEKLDDSQIERRGDGSASRTLRRFPERRETA